MATGLSRFVEDLEVRRIEVTCRGCGVQREVRTVFRPGAQEPVFGRRVLCEGCQEGEGAQVTSDRAPLHPILDGLEACGVNVRQHGRITLDRWIEDADRPVSTARRFMALVKEDEAAGKGLYLHGAPGNGKTALAVACLRDALEIGVPRNLLHFRLTRQLMRDVGAGYAKGTANTVIVRAKRARLLVLDELGKEPITAHTVEVLSEILDYREGGTIVTSNHSLEELAGRYAELDGMEAFISRVGGRTFERFQFRGPDRRFA